MHAAGGAHLSTVLKMTWLAGCLGVCLLRQHSNQVLLDCACTLQVGLGGTTAAADGSAPAEAASDTAAAATDDAQELGAPVQEAEQKAVEVRVLQVP